eukprot:1147203-Pelagomonas_calceolata.AAC.3
MQAKQPYLSGDLCLGGRSVQRAMLGNADEYKFGSHGEADLSCSCSVLSFVAQILVATKSQHVEEQAHGSEIGAGAADCGATGNACSNAHSNACSNAHSNVCSNARSNACSDARSNAVLMMQSCLHVHHGMLQGCQRGFANFSASLATLPPLVIV